MSKRPGDFTLRERQARSGIKPKSTIADVSEAVKSTAHGFGEVIEIRRKPRTPFSILSNIARKTPLGSLLIAFLLGGAVVRRRCRICMIAWYQRTTGFARKATSPRLGRKAPVRRRPASGLLRRVGRFTRVRGDGVGNRGVGTVGFTRTIATGSRLCSAVTGIGFEVAVPEPR